MNQPDKRVDAAQVMREIREKLRRGKNPNADFRASMETLAPLQAILRRLSSAHVISGEPPMKSHRPENNWWVLPLKARMGKLMKWYVKPMAEEVTHYHAEELKLWRQLLSLLERILAERGTGGEEQRLDHMQWYEELETHMRGDLADVAEAQRVYLEYFRDRSPILELGCGQGTFLELCREAGLVARGVDRQAERVHACQQRGLEAEEADLFTALRQCEDGSLGGIFAAQVVEHLKPAEWEELCREGFRALRPGGVMVLETLNPLSLSIFRGSLYADPEHRCPVHPEVLTFFLGKAGFAPVERLMLQPSPPDQRMALLGEDCGLPEATRQLLNGNFERLNESLYSYAHYALIAHRPA